MWHCPNCGESVADEFDACWKCGTARNGTPAPGFHAEPDDPAVRALGPPADAPRESRDESRVARLPSTWSEAQIATRARFFLRILGVYFIIYGGAWIVERGAVIAYAWVQHDRTWWEWPLSVSSTLVVLPDALMLLAGLYLVMGGKWLIEKVFLPAPPQDSDADQQPF